MKRKTTLKSFSNFYLCLIIFFLCGINELHAQKSKEIQRLSFWRMGLLYETGNTDNPTTGGKESIGSAYGIELNINPVYPGSEGNDKANIGWTLNSSFGYNTTSKNLRPYNFQIGFWGGYLLSDKVELGLQYCFLGVYGYQKMAHFGSHMSLAARVGKMQITTGRSGAGAIVGFISPRFDDTPQHFIEASYFVYSGITIGARYTNYSFGTVTSNEYRFFIAQTLGEVISR